MNNLQSLATFVILFVWARNPDATLDSSLCVPGPQFSLSAATFAILSSDPVCLEFNHFHPHGSGLLLHPFTSRGSL